MGGEEGHAAGVLEKQDNIEDDEFQGFGEKGGVCL